MAFKNYSLFKLTPSKSSEAKLFWEFRTDPMWNYFLIYIVLAIIRWIFSLVAVLIDRKEKNTIYLIFMCFVIVSLGFIFVVSKFWKKAFIYLLPI